MGSPKDRYPSWVPPLSYVYLYYVFIYVRATHKNICTHPKYSNPVIAAFKKGNLHVALKPRAQVGLIGRGISLAIPHRSKYSNIGAAGPRYNSDYNL